MIDNKVLEELGALAAHVRDVIVQTAEQPDARLEEALQRLFEAADRLGFLTSELLEA